MTISIEHCMSPELVIADQSLFGVYRPGNIISESESGLRRSRSYADHNLSAYSLQFDARNYTEEAYEELLALMNATSINAEPFWIKEPIAKARSRVPGEIFDGVRSTYVNPVDSSSAVITLGVGIDFWVASHHASANLLTDAQANAVGGVTTGLVAYNASSTISAARYSPLDGQYVFLVKTVSGPATNVGLRVPAANRPAVVADRDYTIQASFLPTDAGNTYRVWGQFYNAALATTGAAFYSESTGTLGEWLHLRETATAPADAATLRIDALRTTSYFDWFLIACLGISPGDNERWFQPSLSPRLIEWPATLPTSAYENQRMTFSAPSCERWTRVALDRDRQFASVELLGNSTVERMALKEVLFP